MDNTSYIALSRQIALQRQMTVVANNLANTTTTGYKGERMLFETVLQQAGAPKKVAYVQDLAVMRDPSDGPIVRTDNPLDLAIVGDGFFSVRTDQGDRYTRSGHFGLNALGEIVNASGQQLLDEGGGPIVVPPNDPTVTIAPDGTVSNRTGQLGRLRLSAFTNEANLRIEGGGLYVSDNPPDGVATGRILQGSLENSNVQGVLEMTRMIEVVRAFEGTQRLIETHHDLSRRAIERLGGGNA